MLKSGCESQKSHKKTIAKYNKLCYKNQYITKVKI